MKKKNNETQNDEDLIKDLYKEENYNEEDFDEEDFDDDDDDEDFDDDDFDDDDDEDFDDNDEDFDDDYDIEEATAYIQENLPAEMKKKFKAEDIETILNHYSDYLEELEANSEVPIDEMQVNESEIHNYVMKHSLSDGIKVNSKEIETIIDIEYQYIKSVGLIDDDSEASLN